MGSLLQKNGTMRTRRGPVVLCILDGVGYSQYPEGDAVSQARMPHFDWLRAHCPNTALKAHGTAVGLPSDGDMGNSEVGHNAMGSGRVFAQGAKLVQNSIDDGSLYEGKVWRQCAERAKQPGQTLHLIGLLSDGNVHSHWHHLIEMVKRAKRDGVSRVRIHGLLDGRDVGEFSALEYFEPLTALLDELRSADFDACIASGGGRMVLTMDRYEADWSMVERGWKTHVLGEGRQFASAVEAIRTLREETGKSDQNLDPFVVARDGEPVGRILDGDAVILFNFRGDRALEISRAFDDEEFTAFDLGRRPDVLYAGMMEYEGDLHIPKHYLVQPPEFRDTVGEYLARAEVGQFAVSETQKFGHVTYFFNGNRSGKFSEEWEEYREIPSDQCPFDEKPAMQAGPITDATVEAIRSGRYQFIRLNYPNGDMVGHTGNFDATVEAMEVLDQCLGTLMEAVKEAGGVLLVTADHGNADEMYQIDKKTKQICRDQAKTSHTLNPVPFIVYDPTETVEYEPELRPGLGISSIAATCLEFLGFEPPSDYDPSLLWKKGN